MNQLSKNSNHHLDPDDSVHHLVTEISYDFSNQIDSENIAKTELLLPENDDSVDQLESETSFEFSNLQIDANCIPETEKLMQDSPENDDSVNQNEAETDSNSQEMTSESEQMTSASPENDDSVEQSAAEINTGINHLQIEAKTDSNSQEVTSASQEMTSASPEPEADDDSVNQSEAEIIDGINIMTSEAQQMTSAFPESEDEDDDDVEEEGEFTFMYVGDNDSYNTELFETGQIRFPLFDQSLLSTGDSRLPITVPVDNVFIESPRRSNGESDGISTGTFCAIPKESESGSPEIKIKSNSTGFSKLWRFRDNMNRSNSDGRDAFVFFQSPHNGKTNGVSGVNGENDGATSSSSKVDGKVTGVKVDGKVKGVKVDGKVKGVKVDGKETEKVVKKGKKKVKSAHEVYLKQKGGKPEDERRRSYLPYRPGLMGFFTNVNGGLSKNVHPF